MASRSARMRLSSRGPAPENWQRKPRVNVSNGEARPNKTHVCALTAPRAAANYKDPLEGIPHQTGLLNRSERGK